MTKLHNGYFFGFCVGGPLAGKRITHHTSVYALVKIPSFPTFSPATDAANQALDPNFVRGHYEFDRKCGIWWWKGLL